MFRRLCLTFLFLGCTLPHLLAQSPAPVPGEPALASEGEPEPSPAFAAVRGEFEEARRVAREQADTPEGAAAALRMAELLQQAGQTERAFTAYSNFLSQYPGSPRFDEAVRAQIEIANLYLNGRRARFLGLPLLSGYERAEKMLATVISAAPFSRFAPMAQFNLGLAYERQGKTNEAIAAYQGVIDRYPGSSVAASALYQIGYVYMILGTRRNSEDVSALIQARQTFEDFLMFYPNSEKAGQAQANLDLLQGRESGDFYLIARFYDRNRQYRSAFIYYNEVIRRAPNTENAELSKVRIDEMRASLGDDALRTGPEQVQTGERVALRRRLQAQVETPSLADYAGPPRDSLVPEELPVVRPRLRTEQRDISPLPALPPVEPDLPEF